MILKKISMSATIQLLAICFLVSFAISQTPSPALLVLEKEDKSPAIVDPATLKVVARAPACEDPHEVATSLDGSQAFISNYGGFRTPQNTISIVDLASQKALSPVNLGPLNAPHGLDLVNGKVYFAAEVSKVSFDNNIAVVDLKTMSVTSRVATGKGPDGLAWAVRK